MPFIRHMSRGAVIYATTVVVIETPALRLLCRHGARVVAERARYAIGDGIGVSEMKRAPAHTSPRHAAAPRQAYVMPRAAACRHHTISPSAAVLIRCVSRQRRR